MDKKQDEARRKKGEKHGRNSQRQVNKLERKQQGTSMQRTKDNKGGKGTGRCKTKGHAKGRNK
jgi:hypothetical protein